MEQEKGGKTLPDRGQTESRTLFQTEAPLSTTAFWKGQTDARIPLRIVTMAESHLCTRDDAVAIFVNNERPSERGEEWLEVKHWSGIITSNPQHGGVCLCCSGLDGLGRFLIALFQERARGMCNFFRNAVIVCSSTQKDVVIDMILSDSVVKSLYGLQPVSGRFSCDS